MYRISRSLFIAFLFCFINCHFLFSQSHTNSTLQTPYASTESNNERHWIEKYAPGYAVSWILSAIAQGTPNQNLHRKLRNLYVPMLRGVDQKIKVNKLSPEIKEAHTESIALFALLAEMSRKPFDKDELKAAKNKTKIFIEKGYALRLNETWIKAGRIGDYSNSLSSHMTSGHLDLQGIAKLMEHGPAILDGSKNGPDDKPMFEGSRHLGAHNPIVMQMNWLNLVKKALSIDSKLRQELVTAYQDARFGDILDAILEEYNKLDLEKAKKSRIGLFQLLEDSKSDSLEFIRGFVFSSIFFTNGDVNMALSIFFEHTGDIIDILSRNRKFVQLHPYGNNYLHTFTNALHLCYLASDPQQHYAMVLKRRIDRLNELETFSEDWHTQFQQLIQLGIQPALDVLHFYSKPDQLYLIGRFINYLSFGAAGVAYNVGTAVTTSSAGQFIVRTIQNAPGATAVAGVHNHFKTHSRSYLNWFQWATYTAVQAGKAAWWLSDTILDLAYMPIGHIRTGLNAIGTSSIVYLSAKIYAGAYGDAARAYTINTMTALWGIAFGDGICQGVMGVSCVETGYNYVKSSLDFSKSENREEL